MILQVRLLKSQRICQNKDWFQYLSTTKLVTKRCTGNVRQVLHIIILFKASKFNAVVWLQTNDGLIPFN